MSGLNNGESLLDSTIRESEENAPIPNDAVIEEYRIEQEQKENAVSDLLDNKGFPFDKNVHKVDKNGDPVLTKNGNLTRKAGRQSTTINLPNQEKQSGTDNAKMSPMVLGRNVANTFIGVAVAIGGADFNPVYDEKQGIDERLELSRNFGAYLEAKQMNDFPPGVVLVMAIGSYIAPRFAMQKTQSKLSKVLGYFKNKFLGSKNAQVDIRDNRERENSSL